jgi:hypothetical protein
MNLAGARSSTGQSTGLLSRGLQVRVLPGAPYMTYNTGLELLVGVAQLVEPRVVIPVVVGSSPIVHPIPTRRAVSSIGRVVDS